MLNNEELARRINAFMDEYGGKADLPIFIRMAMQQFVPLLPSMLAKQENQEELFSLICRLCWVIGYNVEFYAQEEQEALETAK